MPIRDHHSKPFDPGTLAKLELFRLTADGFLSVFIGSGQTWQKRVQVFDFFCGPGLDQNENEGSPILLLRRLKDLADSISATGCEVSILLNDSDENKIDELKRNVANRGLEKGPYGLRFSNRTFIDLFPDELSKMRGSANLVLIDQNGISQFPPAIFGQLRQLSHTDILVFVSSSYAWRFQDAPEISKHLETAKVFATSPPFYKAHRAVVDYYRSLIPVGDDYQLAPFSIKKGSNIYGVMFGSRNMKGLEKFLEAAWRLDGRTGEANYDIDREGRFSLPGELPMDWGKTKKVQLFEMELKKAILEGELATTAAVYRFTLERGFLPKHANVALRALHGEGRVTKITGLGYSSLVNPQPIILI